MLFRRFVVCSLALVGLLVSGIPGPWSGPLAHAQDKADKQAQRRLEKGRKAFEAQDYRKAIRRLQRVADDDGASKAQRASALELIGLSKFILGNREGARESFLELIVLDPSHRLVDDFDSEEIRDTFEEVRREFLEENAPVKLTLGKVVKAQAGGKLTIDVDVELGEEQVKEVVAFARKRDAERYLSTEMTPLGEGRWRARVKTPVSKQTYVLEYYVEARDLGGRPNARLGSPEAPRTLDIAARKSRWYRRWYVVAGGLVVVGITSVILATQLTD